MSSPARPVLDEQARAFDRAVCERLGINPAIVGEHSFNAGFTVDSGEEFGELHVTLTAHLPANEILAMFNGVKR